MASITGATMIRWLFLMSFLLPPSAKASVILLAGSSGKIIQITHDNNRVWKLNDLACLEKPADWDESETYKAPCGWVVVTTFRGAVVKFPTSVDDLDKGRQVVQGQPPLNAVARAEAARREMELNHWEEMIPFYRRLLNGSEEAEPKPLPEGIAPSTPKTTD